MEIWELKEIVSKIIQRQNFEMNEQTCFVEDLGMCSFEIIMLIGEIERKTNKNIDVSSFSNKLNVEELLSSIE